jgi:OOP family OmpA-OmpF porin
MTISRYLWMVPVALAGAGGTVLAQAAESTVPTGFYLGGGITQSRWDGDEFSVDDLDEEDNSWKVVAGYRFNDNFAIEGNYVDFGEAQAPAPPLGEPFNAEAKAFSLFAVGLIPAGPFDFYGKVGAARIDGEGRFASVLFEDQATEFAYGAGVRWRLGGFGINAEYEKYDTDVVGDLDLITLGVSYTFAAR